MSREQLQRLDNINHFSRFFGKQTVDYGRFAILTDSEREEFLVIMEKRISKIRKEKMAILNN